MKCILKSHWNSDIFFETMGPSEDYYRTEEGVRKKEISSVEGIKYTGLVQQQHLSIDNRETRNPKLITLDPPAHHQGQYICLFVFE